MDSIAERRIIMVMLKFVIISAVFSVSLGQTVTVSMEPKYYSDPATTSATLTCDFSVDDVTFDFYNLEWRTNGDIVADFFNGATDPTYRSFCASSSDCTVTRTSSESKFVISSLNMTKNNDSFNCLVTFRKGADRRNSRVTALLVVVVPTKTIVMLNGSSSQMFAPDDVVDISLDVVSHIFQCVVADINPQANFTWTVGEALPDSVITESHVVDTGTGLTTSTSSATLAPDPKYDGKDLICKAVNYKDDPGVKFRLVLKVAADTTTSVTPQDTTTPPSSSQETTMSPTGPTETTSDIVPTSTESPTTINTGTRGSSTTPTGSSEMSTRSSEMTTGSTKMTTGSTEMTNSTYPLTPSTTAHTPETTPTGCTTLCDEATGLSIGIIIGIVVGSLCVVVITVGVGIAILKYNSKNGVTPDSNQSKKGKKKEAIEEEHV